MILESDIREKLAAVASEVLSLEDFADWIDDESWNMHRDSDPDAIELASSAHALLAERDARALDDAALRRELLALLNSIRASVVIGAPVSLPPKLSASKAYWVRPAERWALVV
jgi:hypothetical protein